MGEWEKQKTLSQCEPLLLTWTNKKRREDGVTGWETVGGQSGSHTWRMLDLAEKATTKKSTRHVRSKVSGQQDNARVLAKDKGNKQTRPDCMDRDGRRRGLQSILEAT